MPVYEFKCDECGRIKEYIFKMDEITKVQEEGIMCPWCAESNDSTGMSFKGPMMRRLYTNAGIVFKDGAPGQDIKRGNEDSTMKRQRRKAWLLKDRGDVPPEHVIGLKEADSRFDKKYRDSDLDKQYEGAVKEGQ
jgi:putative FmdB family regulatory protein